MSQFRHHRTFTTSDVKALYEKANYSISKTGINHILKRLVDQRHISRLGRGVYVLGDIEVYQPPIDQLLKDLNQGIAAKFPFIDYCLWETKAVREFALHQSFVDLIIVDVEKEALESVYHFLKESHQQVFLNPDRKLVEEYIMSIKDAIIVQKLISEAPIQSIDDVPTNTLEKLLVDLLHEKALFYFYQGYELKRIFQQAYDKYPVNENKLLRYAARRRKKNEILALLKLINDFL